MLLSESKCGVFDVVVAGKTELEDKLCENDGEGAGKENHGNNDDTNHLKKMDEFIGKSSWWRLFGILEAFYRPFNGCFHHGV